jgi:small subunit ribosomal protein S4
MIRAGQPKHKICRKAGYCLWADPRCPSLKRPYGAGQHGQKNLKKSDYARILFEKQKLRYTYNVTERQFRNAFAKAKQSSGVTAENLLRALETRLDSVVFRSGMAASPFQARQLVTHGHFLLDGKKVNIPSQNIRPGQTVSIRPKSRSQDWAQFAVQSLENQAVPYLQGNAQLASVTLTALPNMDQVPVGDIDIQQTVSFYSRV